MWGAKNAEIEKVLQSDLTTPSHSAKIVIDETTHDWRFVIYENGTPPRSTDFANKFVPYGTLSDANTISAFQVHCRRYAARHYFDFRRQ